MVTWLHQLEPLTGSTGSFASGEVKHNWQSIIDNATSPCGVKNFVLRGMQWADCRMRTTIIIAVIPTDLVTTVNTSLGSTAFDTDQFDILKPYIVTRQTYYLGWNTATLSLDCQEVRFEIPYNGSLKLGVGDSLGIFYIEENLDGVGSKNSYIKWHYELDKESYP